MPTLRIARENDRPTKIQTDALIALVMLDRGSIEASFFREEIGRKITGDEADLPMETMLPLFNLGLVVPVGNAAVLALMSGDSAVGCDTWAPTDNGRKFVDELHVMPV